MPRLGVVGELSKSTSRRFEWKIASFFSLPATKGSWYDSPSFVFANTSLHLRCYPTGVKTSEPSVFLSVYLEKESEDPFHVIMTLCVKKADGMTVGGATDYVCIETNWGYGKFYEQSSLLQNESELMPSGVLTIVCILNLKKDVKEDTTKPETTVNVKEKQSHKRLAELDVLSENLKDFSTNKDSCDTVLQVKDKEFKAHKAILMARSSVFAAMFQHDTLEKQTGCVKIPDCDPESFQEFLDYVYCGKLEDISYHSAFQLYITSNKYDVQKLKEYCVKYLIESLTVDNVCEIVKLADKYDDEEFLSAVQKFFDEKWNKIFVTTEWQNLLKNDYCLVNKLLIELSKTKDTQ